MKPRVLFNRKDDHALLAYAFTGGRSSCELPSYPILLRAFCREDPQNEPHIGGSPNDAGNRISSPHRPHPVGLSLFPNGVEHHPASGPRACPTPCTKRPAGGLLGCQPFPQ